MIYDSRKFMIHDIIIKQRKHILFHGSFRNVKALSLTENVLKYFKISLIKTVIIANLFRQ